VSLTTSNLEPESKSSGLPTALFGGALIVLFAAVVFLFFQVNSIRSDNAAEIAKLRQSLTTEVGTVRDASSVSTAAHQKRLESLQEDLETARTQARSLSSQAKAEAEARAEQISKEIKSEQAQMRQQVSTEISGVRQTAESATAKIADVTTDVSGVKTQLGSTQAELQKTIADLKSMRGDLGVQSGLIATNGSELAALRRLGERNYFEFKLGKTKERQRVGDISLQLKKADAKKNRFTVEVMADDKVTEKKDKSINEPLQFYTSKAKQPYELVVNQVQKDLIVGYLATPKESNGR
jgi:hypothetical protein